jgi:hypothetical protein
VIRLAASQLPRSPRSDKLDQWNRLNEANNAEGESLAGDQEDGEVNPHLLSSAHGLSLKLAGSG